MKILISMLILLSINLLFMKHPLSMGFILLLQTITASLTCRLNLNSHFISYILFLIFIGGILILFIYMSRIASNEKFYFSIKLIIINFLLTISLILISFNSFDNQNIKMSINLYNEYSNYLMNKLYLLPSGNITLLIIIYLLFTLIVVSNIIKVNNNPLRRN